MNWIRQTGVIVRKDLLLEWRGRSRFISVLLFGIVTLLLFSFAVGPDSTALRSGAAGFLVLALLLSSTLGLSESFRLEQEDRALEGLLLLPVEPMAITRSPSATVWSMCQWSMAKALVRPSR